MVLVTSSTRLTPVTRPRFTTGSSSVNIMRSTGSTIFHLPASFRHHLHLCILCIHHCTPSREQFSTSLHLVHGTEAVVTTTSRGGLKWPARSSTHALLPEPVLHLGGSIKGHASFLYKAPPSLVFSILIPKIVPRQL
jgi:hypothetical protein